MFESKERLSEDALRILESLRGLGGGRYAALFDRKGVLLESPDETTEGEWVLRRLVQTRAEALLGVPAALHGEGEMADLFEDWESEEFFLAVVNGRVGLLVACRHAKRLEEEGGKLLRVLTDRLLRFNPAWRVDERGRGLFFGRPRLDTVVIGASTP